MLTEDGYPRHDMYGNDDNEWGIKGAHSLQTFTWHKVPWWVFWRKKWYRRIYDGADRGAGWNVQYATDVERARQTLEERFAP